MQRDGQRLDRYVDALMLEYQAVQSEVTTRQANRFSFIGFVAAALGLLANAWANAHGYKQYVILAGGVILLSGGFWAFVRTGRAIGRLLTRGCKLEHEINTALCGHYLWQREPLRWRTDRKGKWGTGWYTRLTLGPPPPRFTARD